MQGAVGRMLQNLGNSNKMGLVVFNYAGIWRNGNFAIGKSVERINGFIRRNAGVEMNQNLHISRCVVVNFSDFDFASFVGFNN